LNCAISRKKRGVYENTDCATATMVTCPPARPARPSRAGAPSAPARRARVRGAGRGLAARGHRHKAREEAQAEVAPSRARLPHRALPPAHHKPALPCPAGHGRDGTRAPRRPHRRGGALKNRARGRADRCPLTGLISSAQGLGP
jgi:hypothetical protein